jgi:hypothetical protein
MQSGTVVQSADSKHDYRRFLLISETSMLNPVNLNKSGIVSEQQPIQSAGGAKHVAVFELEPTGQIDNRENRAATHGSNPGK